MNQENNHKKGKKIVIILILFLLIILIATYAVYSYYVKNVMRETLKKEVLETLENHDLSFFLENELYQTIDQKMKEDNFELASDIKLSTNMENNMFSNLDLSKFGLTYHRIKDEGNQKNYHKLETKYAGNDLLTVDFLTTQNQLAIKSDEIVNRYVGVNQANFQNTVNELYETEVDLSDAKIMKNFILDREPIAFSNLQKASTWNTYANLIQNEILPENIEKKENVVITTNSEEIVATEYTISFESTQINHLLEEFSKVIETDTQILPELVVSQVQDVENGFLEYTDNNNSVEISGEENNFQTSLEIWGENTTTNEVQNINTVPANTTIEPANTTNRENTTTNQTTNEISNEISSENANTNTNSVSQENTSQESTQTPEQAEERQENTETTQQQESENDMQSVIEEDDNFRTQGYIEVNESSNNTEEDNFIIGENYEETLKNISNWIEKIDWRTYLFTGAKANCTAEELTEEIQKILTARSKQNNRLVVKLYVSQGKMIKISFEFPETSESLDIDIFSKGDNEKYLNITFLRGEENNANGNTFTIYRKKSDTINVHKININKIYKNKISQKTNIDMQTKGTLNAKKYTTNVNLSYSDAEGEFKVDLENTLNFDVNPEIEDLNDENCLFLDTISKEELQLTAEAIKQKTQEVLQEKNRNLNMIDINNSNLIGQPTESNNPEEDANAKEQAKQALIKNIADKMRDYQNEGKQLKIEDLEGLEIPDYEVNISISSNLAIITVNGYHFKLDSDFNLSDS